MHNSCGKGGGGEKTNFTLLDANSTAFGHPGQQQQQHQLKGELAGWLGRLAAAIPPFVHSPVSVIGVRYQNHVFSFSLK